MLKETPSSVMSICLKGLLIKMKNPDYTIIVNGTVYPSIHIQTYIEIQTSIEDIRKASQGFLPTPFIYIKGH